MLLGTAGCAASADDAAGARVEDRAAIEALMWRYVRALDTADADAYAAAYTEDGEFSAGANVTRGREALRKMVAGMRQQRDAAAAKGEPQASMYHMIMNHHLEFQDEDRARIEAYWQTVFGASEGAPVRVAAAGRSVDELVRMDGQWLIRSRNVAPDQEE
jgi:uncharacterized protein (TIGR02246 family)